MLCDIENILAHAELKHGLISLKEFKAACIEVEFSSDEVNDLVRYIALALYVLHFGIGAPGDKEE